jgi:hypothetical protein
MEDWDNPEYSFRVLELRGGVRVRRMQAGDVALVVFEAAGREVSCPMWPDDCRQLPNGHLLPYREDVVLAHRLRVDAAAVWPVFHVGRGGSRCARGSG